MFTYKKFEFEIVTNENDSHFFSFDVETYEKKKPNVWEYDSSKITPLHTFIILAGEQSIILEDKKTNLQNLEKFLNKHLYSFDDLLKKYKEIEALKKSIDKDFN